MSGNNLPTQVPTPNTNPSSSALVYIVDDPYGSPSDDATTIANLVTSGGGGVGPTGPTGPAGACGVSGTTGAGGACGVSGVAGACGVSGTTGTAGACGVSGVAGACGVSGTTGTAGACGVSGVAGACGVSGVSGVAGGTANWRGAYNAGTAYVINDVVSSSGSSYICIANTTGNAPPNATYWALVAQAGACGVSGVAGACGVSGTAGTVGACGVSGVAGACGVSGTTGTAGACGISGVAGTAGACGVSGVAGACGVSGVAGACGVSGVSGVADLTVTNYSFITSTSATGTVTGQINFNNATLASVTNIYFYNADTNGSTVWSTFFDDIASLRTPIEVYDVTSGAYLILTVNGSITLATSRYTVPVTVVASSGTFSASDVVRIGFGGAGGACGVSGVAGACGVSGTTGSAGACGVSGVAGACGVSGVAGSTGSAGACGVSGVAGACGVSGTTGSAGACGVSGVAGNYTIAVSSQSAPGATPTIATTANALTYVDLTGINAAITNMTTNLSGTPARGDRFWLSFTDNGTARAITWGTGFESSGDVTLPTTTVISTRLDVGFVWNTVTSKWRCVAVA